MSTGTRKSLPSVVSSATTIIESCGRVGVSLARRQHLAGFAAHEARPLVHDPVIELLVAFSEGAHVDVELVHPRRGLLAQQVGELERVHAAHARAVLAVVLVARADAVKDADRGRRLAVLLDDLAAGRAHGVAQPLEFQAGVHLGEAAVAPLFELAGVDQIVAGGHDDGADLQLADAVLVVHHDGARLAELFAHAALAAHEEVAVLAVDDRLVGHGLREHGVDGGPEGHLLVELRGNLLHRALGDADAAAGALGVVHAGGLASHLDLELANAAAHFFHLVIGEQLDVGVLGHLDHLGRQDAGRAIQRREGLVQLGHVAADRLVALDQVNLVTGLGDVEGRLDAGDAAADDERGWA